MSLFHASRSLLRQARGTHSIVKQATLGQMNMLKDNGIKVSNAAVLTDDLWIFDIPRDQERRAKELLNAS